MKKSMKPLIAGTAIVLSLGFAGVANAYPPEPPPPPSSDVVVLPPLPPNIQLPSTGGDVQGSIFMGAAVLGLGGGLIVVTRRRKHAQS